MTSTRRARAERLLSRSRPRFWLYLAGPVLVGAVYGAGSLTEFVSPTTAVLFVYFLLPANLYLYGVNDVFDVSVDAENPKKGQQEVRYDGDVATLALVAVSGLLGVSLAAWRPRTALWVVGFLALGWVYSAPPRLKTKPPLDSISNGLYILPGAVAYAALAEVSPPSLALLGGWLWSMGMHTFSAIPDIEPDRRAGIETLATVLGARRTLLYCGGCWLLAAVVFSRLDVRAGLLLAFYPLFVLGIAVLDIDIDRAYWWFPAINTTVGAVLTIGGLWGIVYG